jgi:hypothetical protein
MTKYHAVTVIGRAMVIQSALGDFVVLAVVSCEKPFQYPRLSGLI